MDSRKQTDWPLATVLIAFLALIGFIVYVIAG